MSEAATNPDLWESAAPVDRAITDPDFTVDVDGYEGPLDLLLALARTQKVDLAKISILQLAIQYLEFVDKARAVLASCRALKSLSRSRAAAAILSKSSPAKMPLSQRPTPWWRGQNWPLNLRSRGRERAAAACGDATVAQNVGSAMD